MSDEDTQAGDAATADGVLDGHALAGAKGCLARLGAGFNSQNQAQTSWPPGRAGLMRRREPVAEEGLRAKRCTRMCRVWLAAAAMTMSILLGFRMRAVLCQVFLESWAEE